MKRLCGIDLGIYDSSIYLLMNYNEKEDKLYITKQKEITQEEQHMILSCYYSNPPKKVKTFNLGGGVGVKRDMSERVYQSMKQNYQNKIIKKISGILNLNYILDTVAIDFDRGTKTYNYKEEK